MRILHLASFIGNIGDNASHKGLYGVLDGFNVQYSLEQVEIRRFYKNYDRPNKLSFDESFIEYANSFDLFLIGGGGFLDYWVPDSASGTTLDIKPAHVAKIKVKTVICSVGCFPHKKVPEGNLDRFRTFLDALMTNGQVHLSVRNDGSKEVLRQEIGKPYCDAIPEFLDNGFFYTCNSPMSLPANKPFAAINITMDQLDLLSNRRGMIDQEAYYVELANIVEFLINERQLHIVLVPHIYSDLNAICTLLERIAHFDVRENITIAPCIQGDVGADFIFSIYKSAQLVFASRLHANICSLAMGKKVIGLAVLDRVKYLYDRFERTNYLEPHAGFFLKFQDLLLSSDDTFDEGFADQLSSTELYLSTIKYYESIFS